MKIHVTTHTVGQQLNEEVESERFSSLCGAKLVINGNDDIAFETAASFGNHNLKPFTD